MKIAIITGASSGLGKEFFHTVCRRYPADAFDEIWIIARRKDRLEQLASEYPDRTIRPVTLDLSSEEGIRNLQAQLEEHQPQISLVINNAGLERYGRFDEMPEKDIQGMIDLNVRGTTMVARACLPYMHHGSRMIMTCSVSSFAPVPSQAVYSASKIYIMFLGRALHYEMSRKGVNVLLLCPGNMDTEMNPKGGSNTDAIAKLPYLNLQKITSESLRRAEKGSAVYTPGLFYKCYRLAAKVMPISFMIRQTGKFYD